MITIINCNNITIIGTPIYSFKSDNIIYIIYYLYNFVITFTVSCDTDKLQLDCGNEKCLEYRFGCNGFVDCQNGTDEQNCGVYRLH